MTAVVEVAGLSKQYRLGQLGTGTLSHDLNRWWHRVRGREDPYLKVTQRNDRSLKATSAYVWALQDVSFAVQQGEVLAVIGKNGAGKSTLLKVLSRVTGPTKGEVRLRGRVASLLEVGTGFHPELTGRENVFLNAAILGMSRAEIRKKFDAIVAFSGVERYIDTPVKRYSSGMTVRLAFSVAAHLEPEILIVDEVLAVGDYEFQKKAVGKMHEVNRIDGRTVLFVSHNMAAVKTLCNKGLLLEEGRVTAAGDLGNVLDTYLGKAAPPTPTRSLRELPRRYATGEASFLSCSILDDREQASQTVRYLDPIRLAVELEAQETLGNPVIDVLVKTIQGVEVVHASSIDTDFADLELQPGRYSVAMELENQLHPGRYCLTLGIHHRRDGITIDYCEDICPFEVLTFGSGRRVFPHKTRYGLVSSRFQISVAPHDARPREKLTGEDNSDGTTR